MSSQEKGLVGGGTSAKTLQKNVKHVRYMSGCTMFFVIAIFLCAVASVVLEGINFSKLDKIGDRASPYLLVYTNSPALITLSSNVPTSTPIVLSHVARDDKNTWNSATYKYTIPNKGAYKLRFQATVLVVTGNVYNVAIWADRANDDDDDNFSASSLLETIVVKRFSNTGGTLGAEYGYRTFNVEMQVNLRSGDRVWPSVTSSGIAPQNLASGEPGATNGVNFFEVIRVDD